MESLRVCGSWMRREAHRRLFKALKLRNCTAHLLEFHLLRLQALEHVRSIHSVCAGVRRDDGQPGMRGVVGSRGWAWLRAARSHAARSRVAHPPRGLLPRASSMFAAAVSATAPKGPTTIQKVHHSFGGARRVVKVISRSSTAAACLAACFGIHDGGSVRRADSVNVHRHLAHVAPPRAPMRSK